MDFPCNRSVRINCRRASYSKYAYIFQLVQNYSPAVIWIMEPYIDLPSPKYYKIYKLNDISIIPRCGAVSCMLEEDMLQD